MEVKIKAPYKLELAKEGDAGYDIRNIGNPVKIGPGQSVILDTGVHIEMPKGLFACVKGRSGLWFKRGVSIGQDGVIDSSYRGEIKVKLINLSPITYVVGENERIAQLVFEKYEEPIFTEVEQLSESERGKQGFGHSRTI